MRAHSKGAKESGTTIVVAGDSKGPAEFNLEATTFLDIAAQREFSPLGTLLPTGSYTRKNVGYLWAISNRATVIVETDDDNAPMNGFYRERQRLLRGRNVQHPRWFNAYQMFSDSGIWPRGLPLEQIGEASPDLYYEHLPESTASTPIQQRLADGDPDVDAVFRMTRSLPIEFKQHRTIFLAPGTWCPFNSQNTTWFREAFPLLYLPSFCSFRMTDIWRSFVAQRVAWANGWSIAFSSPDVHQDRNPHDLLSDFEDEVPGYLHNDAIARRLEALDIGEGHLGDSMILCYETLISMGLIGNQELRLLRTWLVELERLQGD
jgi:hypothetical protein